jgi:hypothetical protein
MTRVFNDNNRALSQFLARLLQHLVEPENDVGGSGVLKPEKDDTDDGAATFSDNLAEIEIKGQNDTFLGNSELKNVAVRQSLQTALAQMKSVVPLRPQPLDDAFGNTHVGEKLHPRLSSGTDLFIGEPGGIRQGLLDVFALEIRIISKHLIPSGAVSNLSDDHRDWNAHTTDRGTAAENTWIKCDTIKHLWLLLPPSQPEHILPY